MAQEVFVIDNSAQLSYELREVFKNEKEYGFKNIQVSQLQEALKRIPKLFIVDADNIGDGNLIDICRAIRNDEDNSITPIIIITSDNDREFELEVLAEKVEFYINRPIDREKLYFIIKNLLRLVNNNRRMSPLTGLPGNLQIHTELKKRLFSKTKFTVLYIDLDNFKAYNDTYGFLKGDEIIKFTANIAVKNVHARTYGENFVGHIGGDDFVAIIDDDDYEDVCQSIIAEFDYGVQNYFIESDLERGYLEVPNRKNVVEQFPLTSISIGVVVVDENIYANILEIGEVGAQVKHIAKTVPGSTYSINRRKKYCDN